MQREAARRDVFERYIGEISRAVNAINGTDAKKLYEVLLAEARKRTAIADAQLDEEGRTVKTKDETDELKNDDGVVMVESRAAHLAQTEAADAANAATAGASEEDGDIVRLNGKPKKAKKKQSADRDLF
jgi:hypothetical protein